VKVLWETLKMRGKAKYKRKYHQKKTEAKKQRVRKRKERWGIDFRTT